MRKPRLHLDLQAKISLVLAAVILPTFLIVTIAENKITKPILQEEIRQLGVTSAKTLAKEIVSSRLLSLPDPTRAIENRIQELLYTQPSILRLDVVARDGVGGLPRLVGSNIEEEPGVPPLTPPIVDAVSAEFKQDETGLNYWEILVPVEQKGREQNSPKKVIGTIHAQISTKLVDAIANTLQKTTAAAAAFSVVTLILVLSYFLRKTIANDRKLRQAETQNLQLTEQLHEAERKIMNMEKLAVMGQLTASFAHEIGTPLNAIGGHIQLLEEEVKAGTPASSALDERFGVISGQLAKIEQIVRSFLQSTAKPESQKQLVDLNRLVDRALAILKPRMDLLRVELKKNLDRDLAPLRLVPLDIEQILINLLNNSLDSLVSKRRQKDRAKLQIEVISSLIEEESRQWVEIVIYDTGEGIRKADLPNVLKPFFTTKRPGEGTGLGLTICQQLAHKHGGGLSVDSREGAWTKVSVKFPYQVAL